MHRVDMHQHATAVVSDNNDKELTCLKTYPGRRQAVVSTVHVIAADMGTLGHAV